MYMYCILYHYVCKHTLAYVYVAYLYMCIYTMCICISVSNSQGSISFPKDNSLFLNYLTETELKFHPLEKYINMSCFISLPEVLRTITVLSLWKSIPQMLAALRWHLCGPSSKCLLSTTPLLLWPFPRASMETSLILTVLILVFHSFYCNLFNKQGSRMIKKILGKKSHNGVLS